MTNTRKYDIILANLYKKLLNYLGRERVIQSSVSHSIIVDEDIYFEVLKRDDWSLLDSIVKLENSKLFKYYEEVKANAVSASRAVMVIKKVGTPGLAVFGLRSPFADVVYNKTVFFGLEYDNPCSRTDSPLCISPLNELIQALFCRTL